MPQLDYKTRTGRIQKKDTLSIETQKASRALIITLSCMIGALSIIFLFTTSQKAQQGYELQQLEIESKDLLEESSVLTSKITDATAFVKLKEKEKTEDMIEHEETVYVTKEDNE